MKKKSFRILSLLILTGLASCSKTDIEMPETALKARKLTDLAYGSDPQQKVDVYLPANRNYNTPVIFLIHGGGFYGGDKSDFSSHSQHLADQGFAVINCNYRLVDSIGANATPPQRQDSNIKVTEQLADIGRILSFTDKQASGWIVSASKWGVNGHSAGGTLSLLYAYGELNTDRRIKVAGNWAGVTDLSFPDESYAITVSPFVLEMLIRGVGMPVKNEHKAAFRAVSPYWVLKDGEGVPTLNIRPEFNQLSGTPDASKIQYAALTTLLTEKNIENKYLEVPGADHSFTKDGNWIQVLNETSAFFQIHLN